MSANIAPKGAVCVTFDSNDERGRCRSLIEAVEFEVAISEDRTTAFTLEGDEIVITFPTGGTSAEVQLGTGIGKHSFAIEPNSRRRYVGNFCWDGVTMSFEAATALSHYLLERGWTITEGSCEPGELERAVSL